MCGAYRQSDEEEKTHGREGPRELQAELDDPELESERSPLASIGELRRGVGWACCQGLILESKGNWLGKENLESRVRAVFQRGCRAGPGERATLERRIIVSRRALVHYSRRR